MFFLLIEFFYLSFYNGKFFYLSARVRVFLDSILSKSRLSKKRKIEKGEHLFSHSSYAVK
jgi:hypothetical protein